MRQKLFLVYLLLVCRFSQAAGLEIIPLRHQTAEDMIPIIQPVIGNSGVVTGSGYNLIVRASAQQIEDIKKLLITLDRPVQQLMISVRQDNQSTRQINQQGVSGRLGNDRGNVQFGRPAPHGGLSTRYQHDGSFIQGHLNQRDISNHENISQQVRTLAGRPAYINIGQSRPVPIQQTIVRGNRVIHSHGTQYQNTNTGFYVTPRLNGQSITLEIDTQREKPRGYRVESSNLSTVITGRLGEWIPLGGSNETSNHENSTWFQNNTASGNNFSDISVKVTLAP